jgi:hypothetical protein
MYKSNRTNILHTNNKNISHIIDNKNFSRTRPPSATSNRRVNYTLNNRNSRPNSSKNKISMMNIENDYINTCINPMEQNLILDKKLCDNLKGKLIICKYTNNEGYIDIGPIPYDSYYIEVSENKQYRSVGMCLSLINYQQKIKILLKDI